MYIEPFPLRKVKRKCFISGEINITDLHKAHTKKDLS
jgi:hypothetical protein